MTHTLQLDAIHSTELDFYKALLGSELTIREIDGKWHFTQESYYELTAEQYTLLLLRDPGFLTVEQENDIFDELERQARIENIRIWQLHKKLKKMNEQINH